MTDTLQPDFWNRAVEELGPPLYRYFGVRLGLQEASDPTQETLLRLYRYVLNVGLKPSKGNMRMLAFGIARNVLKESWRSQQRHSSADSELADFHADAPSPHELSPQEAALSLSSLMELLSPDEREVVSLLVDRDLSLAEIAVLIDCPLNTVKSHLHRARKKMAEHGNRLERSVSTSTSEKGDSHE